jgi:hypothetical protein
MRKSSIIIAIVTMLAAAPAAGAKAHHHRPVVRTNPLGWVKAWEQANDRPFFDAQTRAPKSGPLAWVCAWEDAHPGQPFFAAN